MAFYQLLAAEVRLIEFWKALNLGNSLTTILKKVQATSRQASQKQIKSITSSTQSETSFLQPSMKLWYHAPKLVAEALTENTVRTAIRDYVKKLPL